MPRKGTQKLAQSLRQARRRIEQLFIEQCSNGEQTGNLSDDSIAACGQFVGSEARKLGQRGLHGTSAAIKVLSQVDSDQARKLVPRLVKYAENRREIERQCRLDDQAGQSLADYKCDLDEHNVIKLGELLEALACAQQGGVDVTSAITEIRTRLIDQRRDGKGWYYFTEESRPPELLPTAYAMAGLAAAGSFEEANVAEGYLADALLHFYQSGQQHTTDSQTRAIHIACLYAITFRKRPDEQAHTERLQPVFKAIWNRCCDELDHDDEQNVEYWRQLNKTCYVRIPWQLYLLALAGKYSFSWSFSRSAAQSLLARIVRTAKVDGFIYPHSGQQPSARTNAILHETLGHLVGLLQHRDLGILPRLWEIVVRGAQSWPARVAYCLVAGGIILYSLYEAYTADSAMWPQLANGFVGAIVIVLLSAGLRGFRGRTRS
jgi:hypothetical protein